MSVHPLLFVNNLTVIDCSFLDQERGLVGESWIVDIILGGTLNEQGMMMDFSHVKRDIKKAIDHSVDHTLVIPKRSSSLKIHSQEKANTHITFEGKKGNIELQCPSEAITFIENDIVTIDAAEKYITEIVKSTVPETVTHVECILRIEEINDAYYHYSHGLKKHDGNCQRIAHGHRSRIKIWKNSSRDALLEAKWAKTFEDIYIGTKEDISEQTESETIFTYQSPQGHFRLALPSAQCYIIHQDSTIEHIATHIYNTLKKADPHSNYKVQAYEGVNKGAIAKN